MDDIYVICAVVGGTLFLCQLVLSLLGFDGSDHGFDGGGHEVSHDSYHGDYSSAFMYIFSLRAILSAITVFGLVGRSASYSAFGPIWVIAIAVGCGLVTLIAVAAMLSFLHKFNSDGTVHIEQALGKTGTVYLTIPREKTGTGKVTVTFQQRTMEYLAVTSDTSELQSGTPISVVDIVNAETVEVAKA